MRAGRLAILALLPLLVGFDLFKSRNHDVEQGNAAMKAGKAEDALAAYDKAAAKLNADPGLHFDRGTALSALSRFDEAAQEFLRATEAKDGSLKAGAFYNLGNTFAKQKKFKEAIEAYRRTLALDPKDSRAKWNLELALKQQKDEEKKNKDDKNKDDKNKDDKKDQDKKDQDKKDQDKKDQDKKDQDKKDDKKDDKDDKKDDKKDQDKKDQDQKKPDDKKDQPQPQANPEEQKPADQREIESVLDSLEKSPHDLEKKRAQMRAVRRRAPAKDW